MLAANEKEFELIRHEMMNLKDCITKYLGYIFTGSGAAIYGIARMDKVGGTSYSTEMAFVSLALSLIISLLTLIMFYKFHSHNRFAGYCKLLNHERFDLPSELINTSFFSWEVTVGKLRCCDRNPKLFDDLVDKIDIANLPKLTLQANITEIVKHTENRTQYAQGSKILCKALLGKTETSSWGFPPLVASICFVFSSGFLMAGSYLTALKGSSSITLIIILGLTLLIQRNLWNRLDGKLYDLMSGGSTVESFFWKFIPLRVDYLNNYKIKPSYLDVGTLKLCPAELDKDNQ